MKRDFYAVMCKNENLFNVYNIGIIFEEKEIAKNKIVHNYFK